MEGKRPPQLRKIYALSSAAGCSIVIHQASNAASARSQTMRWRSFLSRTFRRSTSSSGSNRSNVMLAG